jgi:hypothetical protein
MFLDYLKDFKFRTLPLLLLKMPASTPFDMSILSLSCFLLGDNAVGSLNSIAISREFLIYDIALHDFQLSLEESVPVFLSQSSLGATLISM